MSSTEQDKKRRRKRRINAEMDEDDLQLDDGDSRPDDGDMDDTSSKSGKQQRTGKRKMKETSKSFSHESIPPKLFKQMKTLLDFLIKYRDKYVRCRRALSSRMMFVSSEDNRVLSKPFMRLPTPKELPEYYEMIKNPVDFNKIKVRTERRVDGGISWLLLEKTG